MRSVQPLWCESETQGERFSPDWTDSNKLNENGTNSKGETIHPSPITLPAPSPYYILCLSIFFFFFALIALAGLKETLEEQSCYGNRASWAEQELKDLAPVPPRVLMRKARVWITQRRCCFYCRRAAEFLYPNILAVSALSVPQNYLSGFYWWFQAVALRAEHVCGIQGPRDNISVIMGAQVLNVHVRGAIKPLSVSAQPSF